MPKILTAPLTPEERAKVFSSDVIHYKDYAKLRLISESKASTEINDIKRFLGDKARRTRVGCIDVRDYMTYYGYTWEDIYRRAGSENYQRISH